MATGETTKTGLDYGSAVRVLAHAPERARPGEFASVCGIATTATPEHAAHVGVAVNTTVYLIEFGDGEAIEVPADWLELIE
jgi:hypothetical protein